MALNYDEIGKHVATIGKRALYLSDKPVEDGVNELKTKGDLTIQPVCDKKTERIVLYVTGMSGSGKSMFSASFIKKYHEMYPKNEVFLFSSLSEDATLDKLKFIKRIKIKEAPFLSATFETADWAKSLVIFDDCDVISNKIIKAKVFTLLNAFLETGRHFNISCIFTSHNATMGLESKKILNECHVIVLFPKNLSGRSSKYILDGYVGLGPEAIRKIKSCPSRWVAVCKTYPQICLSETEAWVVN